jgi:CRISPR-associated helicase Cas3
MTQNSINEIFREEIRTPQLYLQYHSERNGIKLHKFQSLILDSKESINFVHVPVGSGKTYTYIYEVILEDHSALMVLPTNALIEDLKRESERILSGKGKKVSSLTAGELDRRKEEGSRGEIIKKTVDKNDLIITNPDILSYLIHGAYGNGKDAFDWGYVLFERGFDSIVFDEYHLFSEDELAIITAFMCVYLAGGIPEYNPRFHFLSGTPWEDAIDEITELCAGLHVSKTKIEETPSFDNTIPGRMIQKEKKIFINNRMNRTLLEVLTEGKDSIKGKIIEYIEENYPVLFLFDSIYDAVKFDDLLLQYYSETEIGRNTGLETRAKERENIFDIEKVKNKEYKAIVTTNKLEVGVNYPVDHAFMESGRELSNALQRIGRVGRKEGEEEAEVYLLISERIAKDPYKIRADLKEYFKNIAGSKMVYYSRNFHKKYFRKSLSININLIYDSLKKGRQTKIMRELLTDSLRRMGMEIYPITRLLNEYNFSEDLRKKVRERIAESFLNFRPNSFTKRIILKSKRGEIETEYDVIRALIKFELIELKPETSGDSSLIFTSEGRGLKLDEIKIKISSPLCEEPSTFPYRSFNHYLSNFYESILDKWENGEDLSSEVIHIDLMRLIPSSLEKRQKIDLIREYLPLFSPLRLKIEDVIICNLKRDS